MKEDNYTKEMGDMLLEFSCKNHKSIKDKVLFSMIASSDTTREEELFHYQKYRVLRMASVYGANGSGKSTFIDAIGFMKNMVAESINNQPGQEINQTPHKLSRIDEPSEYTVQFVRNKIRYAYGFTIEKRKVSEEYLYYFPNGKQVKIFERKLMNVIPGDRYKKSYELSKGVLKENRLFLSCAANFTNLKEIEEAFRFFREDIIIYNAYQNNWMEYSVRLMQNEPAVKDIFLKILDMLGTGIKNVVPKYETKMLNEAELPEKMPSVLKQFVTAHEANIVQAKVQYDGFETDLMSEESTGIKKLFEMICPIIDIINNGKILLCDEIESGLHEAVVNQIVKIFKELRQDQFAQMIFTTHDTSLLDLDILRRDQIWFTELTPQRATSLYSLAEIKNIRKTENLAKGYIEGKYGAIPMLNKNFAELFLGSEE